MTEKTFIIILIIMQIYFAIHAYNFIKKEKPNMQVHKDTNEVDGKTMNTAVYTYVMKVGPQMKRHFNNVTLALLLFLIGIWAVAPNIEGFSRNGAQLVFIIPYLMIFSLIISVITIIINVLVKDYMVAGVALFNAIAFYIAIFQMNINMNMDSATKFILTLLLIYNTNKILKLQSGTYPFFTWTMVNHIIATALVLLLVNVS